MDMRLTALGGGQAGRTGKGAGLVSVGRSRDGGRSGRDARECQWLAQRAAAGDSGAREALWEVLGASGMFLRWARRRFPCVEDAEDAASEALLRAIKGFTTYRPERGTFLAWVYRVALNAFARYHSSRIARHAGCLPLDEDHHGALDCGHELSCDLMGAEDLRALLDVADVGLSARQITVLWEVAVEGMGHAEVARLQGISTVHCRQEYSRAGRKLRKAFPRADLFAERGHPGAVRGDAPALTPA